MELALHPPIGGSTPFFSLRKIPDFLKKLQCMCTAAKQKEEGNENIPWTLETTVKETATS
jgi:hypothetical protein